MKMFFTRFLLACAALGVSSTLAFAAAGWDDDYDKALAQAKVEKKMVLLDFTGSDWCPPCKMLEKDVFSQKEFKDYAKEKLVLVELDFPQGKKLKKKVVEQNEKLQTQYAVRGYPTVVILDSEGKELARWVGYQQGGPAALIAKIDALKK